MNGVEVFWESANKKLYEVVKEKGSDFCKKHANL